MFLLYAAPQVPMAHEFPQNISANSNFIENLAWTKFSRKRLDQNLETLLNPT